MSAPAAAAGRSERLRRADALIELKRYQMALETLAPLVAGPDGPALCRAARALIGLGDHQAAVAMAERAVAAAPDSEWGHRLRSAALVAMARAAGDGQGPALARQAVYSAREAVRLAPSLPVTYRNAIGAELAAGDHWAAAAALQELIALAPDEAETWNTASLVALSGGNPGLGEAHARRAIALDPGSSEAWNNLGVALQRTGRIKDAVAAYLQSARLDPAESLTRRNIARSGLLILRTIAMVVLLPLLLVPAVGLALYVGAMLAGYYLFRPGGPKRSTAEAAGVRAALRLSRMSFGSRRVQLVLTEGVTRLVAVGSVVACLFASGSSQAGVGAVSGLGVLAAVVGRSLGRRAKR